MVTDKANVTIASIYKVASRFLIGIFTFDLGSFKRSCQCHEHFDCECFFKGVRYSKQSCRHVESYASAFCWHIYIQPWLILKITGQGHAPIGCENVVNSDSYGNFTVIMIIGSNIFYRMILFTFVSL